MGQAAPPFFQMNRYRLLIDSIRGPAGAVITIDPAEAETISILTRNGIVGDPLPLGPEVKKVDAPTETKRRGRPPKNASHPAD